MPLTERIMEAIGLKTHEPVAEVRILYSLQCRKTHAWRCFACQHPQHAKRAVVRACDTIFYALGVPETVSSSVLGLHAYYIHSPDVIGTWAWRMSG